MGALLTIFIIACAEFQRSWPSGTSLIYLAISTPLLGIWFAHLYGWAKASYFAGHTIDLCICVLLVASLGEHLGLTAPPSNALALTLLFWAPLISTWWAWRYHDALVKFVMMTILLFLVLAWQFANSWQGFHQHLILAICLILLVRAITSNTPESESDAGHDPVSGLTSAKYFEAELALLSAISDRYEIPFSLVGCRLPASTLSQQPSEYADAISDRLRVSDTACQWDKNSYFVLLPNTREEQAEIVADKIHNALANISTATGTISHIATAWIQHSRGEDPMSTLNALEQKFPEVAT